jgi:hypothetical protein
MRSTESRGINHEKTLLCYAFDLRRFPLERLRLAPIDLERGFFLRPALNERGFDPKRLFGERDFRHLGERDFLRFEFLFGGFILFERLVLFERLILFRPSPLSHRDVRQRRWHRA